MKRVLYISCFLHERALRPQGLIPELPRLGYQPIVLCGRDGTVAPRRASGGTGDGGDAGVAAGAGEVRAVGVAEAAVVCPVGEPGLGTLRAINRLLRRIQGRPAAAPAPAYASAPAPAAKSAPGPAEPSTPSLPASPRRRLYDLLAFPDRNFPWILPAAWQGLRLARRHRVAVIHASAWPISSLVVGWLLSRWLRVPLVAEFRDLWAGNPFLAGGPRWRRRLDLAGERFVVRRSAAIVVVTAPMKEQLLRSHPGLDPGSVRVIPNGFDPEVLRSATANGPAARCPDSALSAGADAGLAPARPPLLLYAGQLYGRRSPAPLLEACAELQRELGRPPVRLRFVGSVDRQFAPLLQQGVAEGWIECPGVVGYAESVREMEAADALLLLVEKGEGADGIMTGKVFVYLATLRPVLALVPPGGVAAELLRRATGTVVVDPEDGRALVGVLRDLATGAWPQVDRGAREASLEPHTWPSLARDLVSAWEDALVHGRA